MTDEQLRSIAAEFGTPTYVYDLATVAARHAELAAAFPGAELRYAVKANGLGAILRHVRGLGMGAEALTEGELERVLRAGFDPRTIVLGGPGHTPALARRAAAVGVGLVSLDSRGAWDVWRSVRWPATGGPKRFVIRLNPAFDPHTHEHLATAAAHSKFGLPLAEACAVADEVAATGQLAGFHVHAGSMLADPEVAAMVALALEPLYRRYPDLEVVDCGGGYAVPGAPLRAFAEPLLDLARRHGVRLVIEPGRFLVAEAGVLLTTVLHTKAGEPGHLIADAGMADLLRPALYGAEHPVWLVDAPPPTPASADGRVDLDGPLCENADRLGRAVGLPLVPPGSLVAVGLAGAYGYAMASNYASSLRPAQVIVAGERVSLAARREEPADLWRLEDPHDSAESVLERALAALALGRGGVAALYELFTDRLRAAVGGVTHLERAFDNELYAPLLGPGAAVLHDVEVRGDVARALVTARDGGEVVVSLARREHGARAGAWSIAALARDV